MILAVAAMALQAGIAPAGELSRPPPLGTPQAPPEWRTVETRYECGGEEVHFSMRYDRAGRGQLLAARRGSRSVAEADLRRLNESLGRLTPLTAVVPQCAREVHVLTGIGRADGRTAHVLIIWTNFAINASPPMPPVYDAPPGESLD